MQADPSLPRRRQVAPWPTGAALRSFWMAGVEGADHINGSRRALDPLTENGHLERAEEDFRRLARLGLRTVRESLGWRLTERGGAFDFGRMRRLQAAADKVGVQIAWTLLHYGVPPDVDYFDERFVGRFAAFTEAAGREFRRITRQVPVWTVINEINFVSWAISETRNIYPYQGTDPSEAFALKRRLVRAALLAMQTLRVIDPRARFMHVEPVIHVVGPPGDADLEAKARTLVDWQWQAWDLLSGRIEPELGGGPHGIDLLGVCHYHSSQWECGTEERLSWHRADPRRVPLSRLLGQVYERYRRPVVVAETGHIGSGRARWFDEAAAEVFRAIRRGVPIEGVCLYPILDRADWDQSGHWHQCGLFDIDLTAANGDGTRSLRRVLNLPLARALKRWQRQFAAPGIKKTPMQTLIVFSHLRWDFVYQRPQQLLTRLARHYRVLFFEEPIRGQSTPYLERLAVARNIEVLRPHTTVAAPGFHDDQLPELTALLAEYLDDFQITDYLAWFYTPMALPLLAELEPRAVIYDCMDELSAFRNAPRQMIQREKALLRRADVVFTGGPSLFEAKRGLHPNLHCVPSAVDAGHYSPNAARNDDEARRLMDGIARPRLGFFGVIDERFDHQLIAAVADARPDWQFVLAGPVVKIDVAQLPLRPNLHWLGQQPYERLPGLVAQWDVCLLPFALNESTRFISPTKTLEYMAAEKPIVSTPIHDVVALYGDAVSVADNVAEFVSACDAALAESSEATAERLERMRAHVARITWEKAARFIEQEIERVAGAARETASSSTRNRRGSWIEPTQPLSSELLQVRRARA